MEFMDLWLKFPCYLNLDCMDKGRTAGTLFNEVVTLRYEIYTELNHPYKAMRDAAYLCVLDQENKQENVANWLNLQRVS